MKYVDLTTTSFFTFDIQRICIEVSRALVEETMTIGYEASRLNANWQGRDKHSEELVPVPLTLPQNLHYTIWDTTRRLAVSTLTRPGSEEDE
jgi:hypothetical protein